MIGLIKKIRCIALLFVVFFSSCGRTTDKEGTIINPNKGGSEKEVFAISTAFISYTYSVATYTFLLINVQQWMQGSPDCITRTFDRIYLSGCDSGGIKFYGLATAKSSNSYLLELTVYTPTPDGFSELARLKSYFNLLRGSYAVEFAQIEINDKIVNFGKFLIENDINQEISSRIYFSDPITSVDFIGRYIKVSVVDMGKSHITIKLRPGGGTRIISEGNFSFEGWCIPENRKTVNIQMDISLTYSEVIENTPCPENGEIKIDERTIRFSGNYQTEGQNLSCDSVVPISCNFI